MVMTKSGAETSALSQSLAADELIGGAHSMGSALLRISKYLKKDEHACDRVAEKGWSAMVNV